MNTWLHRARNRRGTDRAGTVLLTLMLAAGLAGGAPAGAAQAAEEWKPPARTDVTGIKVKPVTVTPRAPWTAADREVTEDDLPARLPSGSQVVQLGSVGASARALPARAGALPVYVTPVVGRPAAGARAATDPVRKVRVEVDSGQVAGLTVAVSRADGVRRAGEAKVAVDYSGFARAYGGDWAARLQVVDLAAGKPVESVNDRAAGRITVTAGLAASGVPTTLALTAAAAGSDGDYTASSLSAASTWQVSRQTGSFSWSYPIEVPDAPAGDAPKLALSYSSQSADGRTSGTNNQGSWIGDGWDMWPGYIERTYRGCTDDRDEKERADPNNKTADGGDLCWYNDNGTMSLNGSSTELVRVASSYEGVDDPNVLYRGATDDGSRIEQLKDGRDNGDVNGTYWRVTTTDGKQYYFGRAEGQGGSTAGTATDSVWTVPVYGNHPGEPGYASAFAKSRQQRAWRWNLDYVVDPSGNTITYFYGKEGGAYAREADEKLRTTYDRGGYLKRIEYGSRSDAPASARPGARVLIDVADRCVGSGCFDGDGRAVARKFPDTPWDQYCAEAPCRTQIAPTFWTQKRLSKITTQVHAGTGDDYLPVDSWSLQHTYLMAGVNEGLPMWLKSIQHSGLVTSAGGTAQTDPAVVFNPTAEYMPNRVDGPRDGHSSLFRNRISAITTESGAQIGVTYSATQCTRESLPKEHANTKRCFPQYYGAEGEKPKLDWFHKYVVDRVDVYDNTGGFEHEQTNYRYLDTPAWAYDDSELVKPKKRTWSQYRGYGRVEVRTGTEDGIQSRTEYRYFRGMDGDKQPKTDTERPPTGTPRNVEVEDSQLGKVADHPALAGQLREEIVYNGVDGDWTSGKLVTPAVTGPTATAGALKAFRTHIAGERGRTRLSDGSTRWTRTASTVNGDNFVTKVNDFGDEADPADDRCSTNEYTRNEDRWILGTVKRSETLSVNCDAPVQRPRDVLSDVHTYYDDAQTWGRAPDRGLPVRVDVMTSYSGATPQFTTTSRTGYDTSGRAVSTSDALGRTTTTDFVPASGGPITGTTVRNPLGHTTVTTLNRALGKAVKVVTDTTVTEMTYDGSGRVLAVWGPGRSRSAHPKAPTESYAYQLRNTAPSAVTTKTLMPYGNGTYRTSVTLLDGLLRTRQTQTQTPAGGRAIVDVVHNSRGLVDWSSGAYYDIDNTAPNTTLVTANGRPEIPSFTRNIYDGAGRVTDAILIERGTELWRTHTDHHGERKLITPPDGGTPTLSILDGRGRQVEYRQYRDRTRAGSDDPATFDRTVYAYDDRDALVRVTDPGGNTWSYEYDQLGRRTVEKDPDRGTTLLGYDAAGQLTRTENGAGRVLTYEYDGLGRKTVMRRDAADGPKLAEWTYDTLPNGKGRLSGSTRYEYDTAGKPHAWVEKVTGYHADGGVTGTTLTVPSSEPGLCASGTLEPCTYAVGYRYRPNGELDQVVHPAVGGLPAETVTTLYNQAGLSNGLIGEMAGGNQIYAQEIVYNQLDQMIGQNLGAHGSRVALTYGYDEATGRRTTFHAVPELKPEIYNLSYKYSDAGMIESISDSPDENQPGETQCFAYDHVQRMTDAWTPKSRTCSAAPDAAALGGPAPYWHSYTFDAAGNRRTETVHGATDSTRTYAYPASGGEPGSRPHAVTSVTGPVTQQFAYDASGNMLCRPAAANANVCAADGTPGAGSQQLSWNGEGRVTSVKDAAGETSFVYDADGDRVLRRDPAGSTLYLSDGTELRTPKTGAATATRYYSHGGSTIAVRTTAGVQWQVSDHQGTASAAVGNDATRAVLRRRTLPFGEVRGAAPAGWTGDKGFVGGTKDNTGLTHLAAREYDPALGRFISVDPVIDLTDPQQWNGYDYGNNSPVTFADPSGMKFCSDDVCGAGADYVDSTGEYHEVEGHNDGCGGCSGAVDPTYVPKPKTSNGNPSKGTSPPKEQKRNKCSGWDMWCKGKKAASATWEWTKEHKADIVGVGVGVIVGVGCTVLTGGGGAVICGAVGGALGAAAKSWVAGDSGKEIAQNAAAGAALGALGGVIAPGLGSLGWQSIRQFSLGKGLRAGVAAAKEPLLASRTAVKDLSPRAVRRFVANSKDNIKLERVRQGWGRGRQLLEVGKDMGKAGLHPQKGLIPSAVGAYMPGDLGDIKEGIKFRPENMLNPFLSSGFS